MRILQHFLCSALLCSLPSLASALDINVTVFGYLGDTNGSGFFVSNGPESRSVTVAYPNANYVTFWEPVEYWDTESQTYITTYVERTEIDMNTSSTNYTVTVPDTWVGQSVSFTWGYGWTSFTPLTAEYPSFTFNGAVGPEAPPPEWDLMSDISRPLNNRTLIGRWWDSPSTTLFTMDAWDNYDPNWPSAGLDLHSARSNAFWRWMHPSDFGSDVEIAMELDHKHRLTLRRRTTPAQRITLDPEAGQILINGERVLTREGVNSSLVFGTNAYSTGGVALGRSANAYHPTTTTTVSRDSLHLAQNLSLPLHNLAVGDNALSSSHGTSAVGQGARAVGAYSSAFGSYTEALAADSFSGGVKTRAQGAASTALGAYSKATGIRSVAIGYRTTAQGYGQTVVGVNNAPVGTTVATDPASEIFVIGNGTFEYVDNSPVSNPSNAFTVKRNGDTAISGQLNVMGAGETTVAGTLNVGGAGESVVHGSLKVEGALRVQPQGDISMGEFTAGPQP